MSNSSINELFAHSSLLELPKKHILTSSFQNDKNFFRRPLRGGRSASPHFQRKGSARAKCLRVV